MTGLIEITERVANLFTTLNLDIPSEDADLFESGLMDSLQQFRLYSRLRDLVFGETT